MAMSRIREYETIYVMRPDISDVDADKITDRMRAVIREHSGKIVEVNNWGKRKLAYEISKHQKGIYVYWRFVGNTAAVSELERNLRMMEPVLRYLTVKLDESVDLETIVDLPDDDIPMRASETAAVATSSAAAKLELDVDDDDDDDEDLDED
jgi:small subunit ribosomal protein S6